MDVNGVLVDDGGTGVVVMWRMSEARGRNILCTEFRVVSSYMNHSHS